MTNRLSGFKVTLKENMREDDAEDILKAIRMIKGVLQVSPIEADTFSPEVTRIRIEISEQLRKFAVDILH